MMYLWIASQMNIFFLKVLGLTLLIISTAFCQFDRFYPPDYAVKCPPDTEIDPCKCNAASGEIECYGNKINDECLKKVFEKLMAYYANTQERHIKSLKVYKSDVTELTGDTLGDISLEILDLNGNQNLTLNNIHRTALSKSKETLRVFRINGPSGFSSAKKEENDGSIFEIVDGFMQLMEFSLSEAKILKIQRSAFGRVELPKLTRIELPRNEIEELGDYVFYRLPNLTLLNIQDNEIKKLTNYTFAFEKSADELLSINLRGNLLQIDTIDRGAFTRLNRPVHLNLEYNLIEYLDKDVFSPILSNTKSSIKIGRNPIRCDCRMKWLKLDDHNFMDRVDGLICPEATELWYYTVDDLEGVCNETLLAERLAASRGSTRNAFHLQGLLLFIGFMAITLEIAFYLC
ncbi:uncharacterized protein LOC141853741 [Brevipalpus obovatus]|uniref:uncharacterized protein LOC141853741 n=1 Tax=Brevipalpus obovatus TaxID=246614 RepID=UPI003D9F659E